MHTADIRVYLTSYNEKWEGTLEEFFEENCFLPSEESEIQSSLDSKGRYVGGGGASPLFTLWKL